MKKQHVPEWPDKVMFAAMLVIIAGILGALFALLRLGGVSIARNLSDIYVALPPSIALVLSLAMIALGMYAIRHQAAVWVWLAISTGIISLGMLGIVPILCLIAIAFLVKSRVEGEETIHDERTVHHSLWPDKALAASLLVLVGATVTLFQAWMLFADDLTAPIFPERPSLLAYFDLVAGLWGLYAAYELYRPRRAWTGYVACALLIMGLGFWLVGPTLAIAVIVLLVKASREDEFSEA